MSLGALVEMDELVLGLWLVKLIDVGGYANLILLFRAVFFFCTFVRLKVPIVLVRQGDLLSTITLEMHSESATVDELTGKEGFREEINVGNLALLLLDAVLPLARIGRHLDDILAVLVAIKLVHARLLHFFERVTFGALFGALGRVVIFLPDALLEADLEVGILLLSFLDLLFALVSEILSMLALAEPIVPGLHETDRLLLWQDANIVEKRLFGLGLLFGLIEGNFLLAEVGDLDLGLVAHVDNEALQVLHVLPQHLLTVVVFLVDGAVRASLQTDTAHLAQPVNRVEDAGVAVPLPMLLLKLVFGLIGAFMVAQSALEEALFVVLERVLVILLVGHLFQAVISEASAYLGIAHVGLLLVLLEHVFVQLICLGNWLEVLLAEGALEALWLLLEARLANDSFCGLALCAAFGTAHLEGLPGRLLADEA